MILLIIIIPSSDTPSQPCDPPPPSLNNPSPVGGAAGSFTKQEDGYAARSCSRRVMVGSDVRDPPG